MLKYSLATIVTFSALLITLGSCKSNGQKGAEATEEEVLPENIVELRGDQIKIAGVETGIIEMRSLSGTLKASGLVTATPQNIASVCMPMGGFVKNVSLIPGSSVKKGQILAYMENQEFVDIQQSYLEAKSKLEYAKAEYDRQKELYNSEVASQKNMQQVTSDYKSLKAQVNALRQKLNLIGINPDNLNEDNISRTVALTSPISGYIKSVNANIGKSVSSSDVLFEIVNRNNMLLELTLFEKDADKVSVGQKIHFTINNETELHDAFVYQTGKAINDDKTYRVFAKIVSQCKNILPGMYANAIIDATTNEVTSVPADAIVSFDDKDYIFVFERDKTENGNPFTEYRMVEVKKGVTDDGYSEIELPDGFDVKSTKVVVKGAYNLLSAMKNAGEMSC